MQLAKYFDADVTAVCNTKNVELVASLGPDRVIDHTQEDFTKTGETYNLIFDAVGKLSFKRCRGSLNPGGIYASSDLGPYWQNPFLALWTSRIGDKKVLFPIPRYTKKDVLFVKELIEAGKYQAVIDRRYPLEDVVEANRYVETGQKTGNVVLTVSHDRTTWARRHVACSIPSAAAGDLRHSASSRSCLANGLDQDCTQISDEVVAKAANRPEPTWRGAWALMARSTPAASMMASVNEAGRCPR